MEIHKVKKSLGQNFLKSALALKKIIEAGELTDRDIVLEIGPGKGALTAELLACGCQVIAVEKDRELIGFLQSKFANEIKNKKLILVEDDILNFEINEANLIFMNGLVERMARPEDLKKNSNLRNYKVIANIPYNITGAILKKFLTETKQPELMVLMVQHEVAKRIVAGDHKESILSISVKAYGKPKMIMKVPARYFSPAPKVDSAVIAIKNISRQNFKNRELENKFWEIVKIAFAHKRKQLAGNLKGVVGKEILDTFGQKRAEDLTLEDWIRISTL